MRQLSAPKSEELGLGLGLALALRRGVWCAVGCYTLPMRTRATVVVLAVAIATLVTGWPAGAGAAEGRSRRIVVIGVPDLRWDDVSQRATPSLWRLADRGSVGALSVRSIGYATTCADGWLTLGAGNRTRMGDDFDEARPCGPALAALTTAAVRSTLRVRNRHTAFDGRPGALGDALHAAGLRTLAAGDAGPVLALGDAAGRVDVQLPTAVLPADGYDVAAVSLPGLYGLAASSRPTVVADLDTQIGELAASVSPQDDLLIAGITDELRGQPHLHVAIAAGPSFRRGLLRSASTGRAPFVQLIDVAPTVLAQVGVKRPSVMVGQPWFDGGRRGASLAATINHFVNIDRETRVSTITGRSFSKVYAWVLALFFVAGGLAIGARSRRRWPRHAVAALAPAVAVLPVATFVAQAFPWWRSGGMALYALALAMCALTALAAFVAARRWGTPAAMAITAGASAAVLLGDMVTGGRLQISAVLGDSPFVAGRFHGVGNVDFALISTASLLSAASAAHILRRRGWPRLAAVAAAAILAIAVLVDGAPPFGDDLGGSLALAPAALLLLAIASGRLLSWGRALIGAAVAVVPAAAFAAYDYSLPAQRQSHVGRFVGQVLHGGAFTVLQRKASSNLHQLTEPNLLIPLIAAAAATAVLLVRRGGRPAPLVAACTGRRELAAGFAAALACGLLGGLLNDSGVAIPVSAAAVGLSLAMLLCARDAVRA